MRVGAESAWLGRGGRGIDERRVLVRFRIGVVCRQGVRLVGGSGFAKVVHGLEGAGYTEDEGEQMALGKGGVVDEVGVDGVLEVAALVVGQQDVDGLAVAAIAGGTRVLADGRAGAALVDDGVVDGVDDVGVVEAGVGVGLGERAGDALSAKGTADLLEREQRTRRILGEVDVGEAALAEQAEQAERAAMEPHAGGRGRATEAVGERGKDIDDRGEDGHGRKGEGEQRKDEADEEQRRGRDGDATDGMERPRGEAEKTRKLNAGDRDRLAGGAKKAMPRPPSRGHATLFYDIRRRAKTKVNRRAGAKTLRPR